MLQVSYTSDLPSQQFVNITNTNIVLTYLSSGVQYSIVVTAIIETGERIDSDTVTGRTCKLVDKLYFVLLLPHNGGESLAGEEFGESSMICQTAKTIQL